MSVANATAKPATPWQTPFPSAQDAWFWTIGALRARHTGSHSHGFQVVRPCEPDDVLRCLDRLYRNCNIDGHHARVLRRWGERQMAPDRARTPRAEVRLWDEAMDRLGPVLRAKGIIA